MCVCEMTDESRHPVKNVAVYDNMDVSFFCDCFMGCCCCLQTAVRVMMMHKLLSLLLEPWQTLQFVLPLIFPVKSVCAQQYSSAGKTQVFV